jgi:benzil reductase ((S)-benzoin forming)
MATQVLSTEISLHQLLAKVWGFAPGVVDTEMQTTLRTLDSAQFSQVRRFQRLFTEGQLRSPASVAMFLYQAVGNPQFENGGFYDIRNF